MLAGRPAGEAQLLALAAQLEAAAPWQGRRAISWSDPSSSDPSSDRPTA
jgi:hypothetical protein